MVLGEPNSETCPFGPSSGFVVVNNVVENLSAATEIGRNCVLFGFKLFLKLYLFIYLFIFYYYYFGCVGSSLLRAGFL